MKRIALLLGLAVFATVVMQAQRKTTQQREEHAFEEAVTRAAEPEVKVFIHPLIADLQMIETERQPYGPYTYARALPSGADFGCRRADRASF